MSIDAQKRLQRNTKDLFRIYGYPRNPDHFVFLFPFPSLLNIPISEIFIVFGNEHLTKCLSGVVISGKIIIWKHMTDDLAQSGKNYIKRKDKRKSPRADNFVFRLHYQFTFGILVSDF